MSRAESDRPSSLDRPSSSLGIYVHLPFCATKCNYCDFSTAIFEGGLALRYQAALLKEVERTPLSPDVKHVDSIFFGGGTPSLVDQRFVEEILSALARRFSISAGSEITLEMNPSSEESAKTGFYRGVGINRLSIGVQSFDDRELAAMTRAHTSAQALEAVWHAAECGFGNVSLDLMLGLPGQSERSFMQTLNRAAQLPVQHISIYMLELHSGTPLHGTVTAGEVRLPSEDFVASRYRSLVPFLDSRGLAQYEISNFARHGFQSTHNLKYWTRQPYLGFGVSSHSFDGARRWSNPRSLQRYMERVEAGNFEGENRIDVTRSEAAREQLFLGLRLRQGVPAESIGLLLKRNAALRARWETFISEGWIEELDDSYRFTVEGFLVSNSILSELI